MRYLYALLVVVGIGCGGSQMDVPDEPKDVDVAPAAPAPPATPRATLERSTELPKVVRNTLRRPMQHHAENLENLMWSTVTLDYETVSSIAKWLRTEPKLSRTTEEDTVNRYIPTEFFDLQDTLHEAASELAIAADNRDDEAMADAYARLTVTCVRCHSLYLALPAKLPER